jgi:ATP dependent DNA ligase domain
MGGLPRLIKPMLASLRAGLPADDERYGWEFKWDGVRAIAYASKGRLRLVSRNGNDMTAAYPELGVLAGRVSVPVILDGEIIAIRGGRCAAPPARSPPPYPLRTPTARSGCNPGSSARSPSPNGPAIRSCATPAGAGCAPIRTPAT